MKEESKIFWYAITTILLSLILMSVGVFFYFYQSTSNPQPSEETLRNFAINLALWESIVAISGIFFLYRLFNVHLRHKRETQEIFKGLFEAISHRFGNFLATQKVNITLLKDHPTPEAVQRLEKNVFLMERDFHQIISILRNLEDEPLTKEEVDLYELLELLISEFVGLSPHTSHKKYKLRKGRQVSLLTEPLFIRTVLLLLLDNAFRYSKSSLYIRYGRRKTGIYCFIHNDIDRTIPKGTGFGLKLSRYFIEKIGGELKTREKNDCYSSLVVWKG